MNYQHSLEYLNSFINYEKNLHEISPTQFRLDRMERLLLAMGDPQKNLKFVHVAGSKGKGSTCVMVANILKCQGYRVGLYTSPHLHNVRERIRILEKRPAGVSADELFPDAISQAEMAEVISSLEPILEDFREDEAVGNLTFFEALTGIAIYYFNRMKCDVVVLETGLGGRLDATNSVDTLVCGITSISMEHMHLLGDTLDKIAAEKAAIIKNARQKVILAPQEGPAMAVLLNRCHQFDLKPVIVGNDIVYRFKAQDARWISFDLRTPQAEYYNLVLGLAGRHQLINASVAIGIIEALREKGLAVSREAVENGVKEILWPGRFEIVQEYPSIILDGAHNEASARALAQTIQEVLSGKKIILILGASQLKDIAGMCREFNRFADVIVATKSHHPRVHEFTENELQEFFPGKKILLTADVDAAMTLAKELQQEQEVIIGSGSLYLVSEMREKCTSLKI
jgi:dihydrofolate synthase / folylpolyglutamate synthase